MEIENNEIKLNGTVLINLKFNGLPPTVNQMYRNSTFGSCRYTRRYKTAACRKFQESLVALLKAQWNGKTQILQRVSLYVNFSQKDRRRWDIDNRIKSLQDCLQLSGIIKDDSQIDLLILERQHGSKESTTQLILRLLED